MPFLVDDGHPNATHCTHVWRDDDDDDGITNSYTSEEEARKAFDRLEEGGQYRFGGLYRWDSSKDEWLCLDAWPDTFDGFGETE